MSSKKKWKAAAASRDAGGFVALPWAVLDSPAYQGLTHPAKSLMMEFARQYVRDNNGRLLASGRHLAQRGWTSNAVITRAKQELVEAGFIYETVKGHRPNKASWYAVTWATLDHIEGFDPGARIGFQRGAYRSNTALLPANAQPKTTTSKGKKMQNTDTNGYVLTPSGGAEGLSIAPSGGVESAPPTPSGGAIRGVFDYSSTPSGGDHLEKPSTDDRREGAAATSAQPKTANVQFGNGIYRRLTIKPKHLFTGLLLAEHQPNPEQVMQLAVQRAAQAARKAVAP